MAKTVVSIKCRKCRQTFQPDVRTRGLWFCPNCRAKNPNLKRHYRAIADLFIIGLVGTAVFIFLRRNQLGLGLGIVFATNVLLLVVASVAIYMSKAPWADPIAKLLIWIVFGLAFVSNVILPLLLAGRLNIVFVVLYALIFPYLFWLNSQANKCADWGSLHTAELGLPE